MKNNVEIITTQFKIFDFGILLEQGACIVDTLNAGCLKK